MNPILREVEGRPCTLSIFRAIRSLSPRVPRPQRQGFPPPAAGLGSRLLLRPGICHRSARRTEPTQDPRNRPATEHVRCLLGSTLAPCGCGEGLLAHQGRKAEPLLAAPLEVQTLGLAVSLAGAGGRWGVGGPSSCPHWPSVPSGHPPWSDGGPEVPLTPALPNPLAADWFPGSDLSKSLPAPRTDPPQSLVPRWSLLSPGGPALSLRPGKPLSAPEGQASSA